MSAALESVALLLILTLALMADGIMESYGPGVFAATAAAILATAELLRMTSAALDRRTRAKRKAPYTNARQSTM